MWVPVVDKGSESRDFVVSRVLEDEMKCGWRGMYDIAGRAVSDWYGSSAVGILIGGSDDMFAGCAGDLVSFGRGPHVDNDSGVAVPLGDGEYTVCKMSVVWATYVSGI